MPRINHFWYVALQIRSRGLSTLLLPHGNRMFTMTFDFVTHDLVIQSSDGATEKIPLEPTASKLKIKPKLHLRPFRCQVCFAPAAAPPTNVKFTFVSLATRTNPSPDPAPPAAFFDGITLGGPELMNPCAFIRSTSCTRSERAYLRRSAGGHSNGLYLR